MRTKEERLDGIGISSYFCLAFAVNETDVGAKEQEAVPKAGSRPRSVRKTPEKGVPSPFEAFPQVQADKAGKRANLGTFR